MDEIVLNEINEIVDIIKEKIHPVKIILFGSYATGNENKNSDIDLCIITEEDRKKIEIMWDIREAIFDFAKHSVDLVVYKNKEFYDRKELSTTLESQIYKYGKVLYG